MDYWAKAPLNRDQAMLFYPTLGESIPDGHPVRLLEEILRAQDWSSWEAEYDRAHGQPPIPPWVVAAVLLYGLMRRIRSSRQLEYACGHNIDFMWLSEGRRIDHTTLCNFRTKFKEPLKELFKQTVRLAMVMGLVQLIEVAFDGTRVKANASRHHTWTVERIEAILKELEAKIEQLLKEASDADAADAALLGDGPPRPLPPELADAKQRRAKLQQVLEQLREADAARKSEGLKTPAQLPKADTESSLMPNKEGGYAPNYTPVAATDAKANFIIDCDVTPSANENMELLPAMDRIQETCGKLPESVSADGAFGTGPNLEGMDQRGVEFYTPMDSPSPQPGNPALREDPRQPVAEAEWPKLPRNNMKRLDKCCFVYDAANDLYCCPMGKEMRYRETKKYDRSHGSQSVRIYGCKDCAGCPLAGECVGAKSKNGRSVGRDGYEPAREQMHVKMQTEQAKETYGRRMHVGETPFAVIKNIFEVRRFLLRGQEKTQTEWRWVCTGYNLNKLVAGLGMLRAAGQEVTLSTKG